MDPVTTKEVLLAAADYMDAHGKATGHYSDKDGRVCAIGAITAVLHGDPNPCGLMVDEPTYKAYRSAIALVMKSGTHIERQGRLIAWSDRVNKDSVVRRFRKAAATP